MVFVCEFVVLMYKSKAFSLLVLVCVILVVIYLISSLVRTRCPS